MGLILLAILAALACALPPVSVAIDGDFADWAAVPQLSDPWWPTNATTDEGPMQGFPPGADVHEPRPSSWLCDATRAARRGPDLMAVAVAHDPTSVYVYARTVEPLRDASLSLLLDVDDDVTTGSSLGLGGGYPDAAGFDVELRVTVDSAGAASLAWLRVFSSNSSEATVALGQVTLGPWAGPWTDALPAWVYRRSADASWCRAAHALPAGWLCFVHDLAAPSLGSVQVAAADGQLELSVPLGAFLRVSGGAAVVALGSTLLRYAVMVVQSGTNASSDASWAQGYWVADVQTPPSTLVVLSLVVLAIGACAGTLATYCFVKVRAARAGYEVIA